MSEWLTNDCVRRMSRGLRLPFASPVINPAYLTGARPVVGTLGACGLMLLACSWLALAPGKLGRTREVGAPSPVRIDGRTVEPSPAQRAAAAVPRARRTSPRAVAVERHPAARRLTARQRSRTPKPIPASAQPPSTGRATPPPAAEPSPPPAPATERPAIMPTPPVPVGDLPQATLPPVAIPSLPDVAAPDIGATTLPLGLP